MAYQSRSGRAKDSRPTVTPSDRVTPRIGVALLPHVLPFVSELEEAGIESVWAPDHLIYRVSMLDPIVLLAAASQLSSRMTLGTAVYILPLRQPILAAKTIASLDSLCGGRLELGVGMGGEFPEEFCASGVDISERKDRLEEAIALMRSLFSAEAVTFKGRFFSTNDVTILPRVHTPVGPPILIGGRSEEAARRAGRIGDGYFPFLMSPKQFADRAALARRSAEGHGRSLDGFDWSLYTFVSVDLDEETALARARSYVGQLHGRVYDHEWFRQLCIVGTVSQCRQRIADYASAGVQRLVLHSCGSVQEVLTLLP